MGIDKVFLKSYNYPIVYNVRLINFSVQISVQIKKGYKKKTYNPLIVKLPLLDLNQRPSD